LLTPVQTRVNRLLIGLFSLSSLVIALSGILPERDLRNQTITHAEAELRSLAHLVTQHSEDTLQSADNILVGFRRLSCISARSRPIARRAISSLFSRGAPSLRAHRCTRSRPRRVILGRMTTRCRLGSLVTLGAIWHWRDTRHHFSSGGRCAITGGRVESHPPPMASTRGPAGEPASTQGSVLKAFLHAPPKSVTLRDG
jgi:hypothetical protein